MKKKIYGISLILVAVLGLASMLYFVFQPQNKILIPFGKFPYPAKLAADVHELLLPELQAQPLLFIGLEPSFPDQVRILQEFININQASPGKYSVWVMDQGLQTGEFPNIPRVAARDDFEAFVSAIQQSLQAGNRVAVILPNTFAIQDIPGNLVQNFKQKTSQAVLSLSFTDFPRSREAEKSMVNPCNVEAVDQSGVGPFGCLVAQTGRAHYRQRFQTDDLLGLFQKIGSQDYLLFTTREK